LKENTRKRLAATPTILVADFVHLSGMAYAQRADHQTTPSSKVGASRRYKRGADCSDRTTLRSKQEAVYDSHQIPGKLESGTSLAYHDRTCDGISRVLNMGVGDNLVTSKTQRWVP
jgi:hypothetical protein